MGEPGWVEVDAPSVTLRGLTWTSARNTGDDAPIALCLHGFPDTAHGWRAVAPQLAAAGWRVVAPFMRGYAPSTIPSDGSYHIGALMDDAVRVLDAVGRTGRDVIVGHDWGAIAAAGLAAMPDSPFRKAVIMSVPLAAAFQRMRRVPDVGRLATQLPRQLARSWYIMYFQLPLLPERSASWLPRRLWRHWSPGYYPGEDLRHVDAAIGTPESWRAALGPYRATVRNTRPPGHYAELHRHWLSAPTLPTLYLHGADDGCVTPAYSEWVKKIVPPGSAVQIVEHAGHFLQLEQPDVVAGYILDFLGRP
jgi:pimeloyl-ACP methyl ester carboxylesterase